MREVIIIGSGPAGFTAGIYTARAGLNPLLIASSVEIGGELMKTTEVENFPGFPEGLMGPDLMANFQAQAERFGTEILFDDVVEVDLKGDVKIVKTGAGETFEAKAVIISTGAAYRDDQPLTARVVNGIANRFEHAGITTSPQADIATAQGAETGETHQVRLSIDLPV